MRTPHDPRTPANALLDTAHNRVSRDGIDRRGFLQCMAWAGAGLVWTFSGGVPISRAFGESAHPGKPSDFTFVQISDSHIGFSKPANNDVTATLQTALARIDASAPAPDFIIHTGDLTHSAKPSEFDTLSQLLSRRSMFYVPGEHDTAVDDGKLYLQLYGKNTQGSGWYSFNHNGVHFIGLVNVLQLEGMGRLGQAQLDWLKQDLRGLRNSTPIVVFAHIPLWAVYPAWGWGTSDSELALALLQRFGSVTVLNGHIHQVMQKVEGNVTFHTAMSTAFPQPAPGSAPSPGPMKVSADRLQSVLGITQVRFAAQHRSLAIVDATLSGAQPSQAESQTEGNAA
jgi:3',5'-cyclic-AMP phosphodiesterase